LKQGLVPSAETISRTCLPTFLYLIVYTLAPFSGSFCLWVIRWLQQLQPSSGPFSSKPAKFPLCPDSYGSVTGPPLNQSLWPEDCYALMVSLSHTLHSWNLGQNLPRYMNQALGGGRRGIWKGNSQVQCFTQHTTPKGKVPKIWVRG